MQKQYPTADHFWKSSQLIVILSPSGQPIGRLPVQFVRDGGDNTWHYVLDIVSMVLENGSGGHLESKEGKPVEASAAPEAGTYTFRPDSEFERDCSGRRDAQLSADGETVVMYTRGPESNRRFAPATELEEATVSASSRCTGRPDQASDPLQAEDTLTPDSGRLSISCWMPG